jgi:hypothetical protein
VLCKTKDKKMKKYNIIKIIKTAKHPKSVGGSLHENQKPALHLKGTGFSSARKAWLLALLRHEEDHIIHIILLLTVIILGSCSHH